MTTLEMVTKTESVELSALVLDVMGHGTKALDTNVRWSVLDLKLTETMAGAPTIALVIHDPQFHLLDSDVLWVEDADGDRDLREIRVEIEDHGYILANCRWSDASSGAGIDVTLTFEHELAYYMKRHRGAKKARRELSTLAEFMYSLSREIREIQHHFVSPNMRKKRPIEKASKEDQKQLRDSQLQPGLADHEHITVKGAPATPVQKRTVEAVLRAGEALGASNKVLVVGIMTITQESDAGAEPGTSPSYVGPFQQEARYGTVEQRKDPFHSATAFFQLAMRYEHDRPSIDYAELAEKVQISGRGSLYARWKDEARHTVRAFGGSGHESTIAFYNTFNYTRRREESTWGASQRWAETVNWRSFVRGRDSWVFASEPELFRSRPQMIFDRINEEVTGTEGDLDRNKAAKTLTVTAHIARWSAPAGTVVVVKGYGPADGRWLVEEVERSYFRPEATITLKKPTKPRPEPREQLVTTSLEFSSSLGGGAHVPTPVVAAYREAYIIHKRNYPYVWGGGHEKAGEPSGGGFDCSGYVVACLAAARLGFSPGGGAATSGALESWGAPGKGRFFTVWANSDHVWIQWHIQGAAWRADTSPHGDGPNGPHLRNSARETAGFTPRHWPGL